MARTAKRHDTLDPITGVASDANGPVDLTQFDSVEFQATNGTEVISGPCSFVGSDGRYEYEQTDEDMSIDGKWEIELECIDGTKKVHFPSASEDNPVLTIDKDIDDA